MPTQLIKQKNLLTAQINTIFLPDQWRVLEQLLTDVNNKTRSMHKSEKIHKHCCLVKKAKNEFKSHLYNAAVRLSLTHNVMLTSK